jgi:hypothetical protein
MLGMASTLGAVTALIAGAGLFVAGWAIGAWLLCALLVGFAARSRGRSFALWLLLAVVATPIVAALMLMSFADRSASRVRDFARKGRDGLRLCPSCAEVVWGEARRCRFCLADLAPKPAPVTRLSAAPPADRRMERVIERPMERPMERRTDGGVKDRVNDRVRDRVQERVEPSLQ